MKIPTIAERREKALKASPPVKTAPAKARATRKATADANPAGTTSTQGVTDDGR